MNKHGECKPFERVIISSVTTRGMCRTLRGEVALTHAGGGGADMHGIYFLLFLLLGIISSTSTLKRCDL